MVWFIIIVALLINESKSGERWSSKAVRNLCIIVAAVIFAEKNPGGVLVLAIVAFSAFVAIELYRTSLINEKSRRKRIT